MGILWWGAIVRCHGGHTVMDCYVGHTVVGCHGEVPQWAYCGGDVVAGSAIVRVMS